MTQSTDTITPDTAAPTAPAPAAGDTPPVPEAGKPVDAAASTGDILDIAPEDDAKSDVTKDVLSDDDASGDEGVPDRYTFDVSDELKEKGFEVDEAKFEKFSEAAKGMAYRKTNSRTSSSGNSNKRRVTRQLLSITGKTEFKAGGIPHARTETSAARTTTQT